MNISALRFYKEVVEMKSISKVAQNSHISQSALSQMMQKLESELGYQLLNRSNKGVYPTEMGKIVYKYSGTMIRIHEKMMDELVSHQHQLANVKINGYGSFINYSLPCIMYKIKKKFPMYKFELHSKTNEETFNDLLNEVTDIGFVNETPLDESILYDYIGKERIVLAASVDSRIPDTITVQELVKYEMILLDSDSTLHNFLKKKLKLVGLSLDELNILFEIDSIGAAKSSVRNNLGVSFLPYMAIKKELYQKEFKIVEIEDFDLDYNIYLASRKDTKNGSNLTPIVKYFIKSGSSEFC
ncbi:MAG: LysR family transcriptional regulator [Clostridia bacterium]|nr:LysR family transcriptional regulator [Clostridia bacterium]